MKTKEVSSKMLDMKVAGKTLEEIGDIYGISRQRVSQILKSTGKPFPIFTKVLTKKVVWNCKQCGLEKRVLPFKSKRVV